MKTVAKIGGKVAMFAFLAFVGTFTLYMTNGENKLIYYVIRPLLNKHYDSQVRDRRIVLSDIRITHSKKTPCYWESFL